MSSSILLDGKEVSIDVIRNLVKNTDVKQPKSILKNKSVTIPARLPDVIQIISDSSPLSSPKLKSIVKQEEVLKEAEVKQEIIPEVIEQKKLIFNVLPTETLYFGIGLFVVGSILWIYEKKKPINKHK